MDRPDPADESKIIDLRQLGALIVPRTAASGLGPRVSQSAIAVPSFGGNHLGVSPRPLLVPPPYLPPAPQPAIAPTRPSGDTTVLLVMVCGLVFVVLGLTLYVVLLQGPRTIYETVAVTAAPAPAPEPEPEPVPRGGAAAVAEAASPTDAEANPDPDPDPDAQAPTDASDTPAAVEAEPAPHASTPPRARHTDRPRDAREDPKPRAAEPRATPEPPTTPRDADLSPECIIDPASCGLGGTANPPATAPKPAKPTKDPEPDDLPQKLTQAQIRDGIAAVKDAAKNCRAKHGAAAGENVQVKLTIQGSSGRVTSAAPVAPHAGTPLGGCVAGALKQATFQRFGAAVQGVQYGVRL